MRIKSLLFTFAAATMFAWPLATQADTNKTISTIATGGTAHDVVVVNNYAYIANQDDGINIVDVSTPSVPVLVTTFSLPGTLTSTWSLDIVGDRIYAVGGQKLVILSKALPTNLQVLGTYNDGGTFNVGNAVSDGTYVYVTGYRGSQYEIQTLDVSNPAAPALLKSLNINSAADLTVAGSFAYVVGGRTLDIVNAYPALTLAGTYTDPDTTAGYQAVQVFGSVAYINDAMAGFHAVSVTDPAAPVATFNAAGRYGFGLAISNGYAFLNQQFAGGVAIYDFASAGTPVYVDSYTGTATNFGLTIANDVAYVAAGTSGLQLIDVSKPDAVAPSVTPVGVTDPAITLGGTYTDPGVDVTDNVGGTGTVVTGTVDTNKVGNYTLIYTVTDRGGNTTVYKRTVIVGPAIEKLKLKNNTYPLKVGKKNIVLKPFANYRGAVLGRKMIVDKKTNPLYVFIATDAMSKPEFVMYNASGKQVTRFNLTAISTKGLQLDIVSNPKTLSVFISVASKTNGLVTRIYNISKGGFKALKTVTAAKGKGTLVTKWIKGYDNEYVLATLIKGKTATPYVWRYSSAKKSFVRDAKFDTTKLTWTKTSIKLK